MRSRLSPSRALLPSSPALLALVVVTAAGCSMPRHAVLMDEPTVKVAPSTGPVPLAFRAADVELDVRTDAVDPDASGAVRELVAETLRDAYEPSAAGGERARVHVTVDGPEVGWVHFGLGAYKKLSIDVETTLPSGATVQTSGSRFVDDDDSAFQQAFVFPALFTHGAIGCGIAGCGVVLLPFAAPVGLSVLVLNACLNVPLLLVTGVFSFINLGMAGARQREAASNLLVETLERHAADLAAARGGRPRSPPPPRYDAPRYDAPPGELPPPPPAGEVDFDAPPPPPPG